MKRKVKCEHKENIRDCPTCWPEFSGDPQDPVAEYFESKGFKKTRFGNFSGHDWMLNSDVAAFFYNVIQQQVVMARLDLIKSLETGGYLGQWDADRIVHKYEQDLAALTQPSGEKCD